jgi:hypothetical protein
MVVAGCTVTIRKWDISEWDISGFDYDSNRNIFHEVQNFILNTGRFSVLQR